MAKLYVVPTPVGNLEDMTFRAISVLREVDCILAEDTRTSGILLKHFDIHTRMQSHHKFNEHQTIEGIVSRIEGGENIALISDAGTPAISDPGFLLVRECRRRDVTVECLPGATAFVPALVASGLPNEKFSKDSFPKRKAELHDWPNWRKNHAQSFFTSPRFVCSKRSFNSKKLSGEKERHR